MHVHVEPAAVVAGERRRCSAPQHTDRQAPPAPPVINCLRLTFFIVRLLQRFSHESPRENSPPSVVSLSLYCLM